MDGLPEVIVEATQQESCGCNAVRHYQESLLASCASSGRPGGDGGERHIDQISLDHIDTEGNAPAWIKRGSSVERGGWGLNVWRLSRLFHIGGHKSGQAGAVAFLTDQQVCLEVDQGVQVGLFGGALPAQRWPERNRPSQSNPRRSAP